MDLAPDRIDVLDVADLDVHAREHSSERNHDMRRLDRSREDVREERLKDEVVVAADEGHRGVATSRAIGRGGGRLGQVREPVPSTESSGQLLRRRHACEAAPEDDDPLRVT